MRFRIISVAAVSVLFLHALATGQTVGGKTTPAQDRAVKLPQPPQDKATPPLPPVLDPARSPVERRDLLQRFTTPHPIEGFYRLRHMVVAGGATVASSRGYLVLGQRHLAIQLYAPGPEPELANISAAVRSYKVVGDKLEMTSLLGHRNKDNGDIGFEPLGRVTQLEFLLAGSILRLHLAQDEYLEFERIE